MNIINKLISIMVRLKLRMNRSFISAFIGGVTPLFITAQAFAADKCGGDPSVTTSIDFGCSGKGNPILDILFAITRFVSGGVGLIIIGSLIYAGIQYTSSRGDPNETAKAIHRIQANVIALLLFIFAFAIINYVVPGKILQGN